MSVSVLKETLYLYLKKSCCLFSDEWSRNDFMKLLVRINVSAQTLVITTTGIPLIFIYLFIAVHVIKWYRTMHNKLMKRVGKLQNHLLGPAPIIHR